MDTAMFATVLRTSGHWRRAAAVVGAGVGGLVLSACGLSLGQPAATPTPAVQHIKIAISSASYAQIAAPVAQETGIFRKNGIEAEFVFGPNGTSALIAGEVQASMGATEEIVTADEGGANLESVASLVPYLQHVVMARPEIKTVADLKDKPVGVTKRGSLPDTVIRMALRQAGLDPDHDVQIVELGTTDKQIAALSVGAIYAASFSPPNDAVAASQGAHVLVDFRSQHIPFPAAQVVVRRDWAAKNDATVMALLRSLAEAEQVVRTQPDRVAQIYAAWAKTGPDAAKQAVVQATEAVPVEMLPTVDGMRAVQQVVALQIPSAGTADPRKYFDDQYILRLEKEGLYSRLGQ